MASILLVILVVIPIVTAHAPVISGVQVSGFIFKSNQTGNYSLTYNEKSLVLFNNSLENGTGSPVYTGSIPMDMVYNPVNSFLYVTTWKLNGVTNVGGMIVINTSTDMPVTTVNVGNHPWIEVLDPQNGNVYVSNTFSSIVVVNSSSNKVSDTFNTGTYFSDMVFDSTNGLIYATNAYSDNVTIINPAFNNVTGKIYLGTTSSSIAYDSENNYLYVSHASVRANNTTVQGSGIFTINPTNNEIVGSVTGATEGQLLLNSGSSTLFCSNFGSGNITVINTQKNAVDAVIKTYSSDGGSGDTVYDPVNHNLYFTGWNVTTPNTILVINALNYGIVKSIKNVPPAYGLLYIPSTQTVYESANDNSIKIINGTTNNVTDSIILKWAPNFVYYSHNNTIYTGNGEDGWQGTSNNTIGQINGTTNSVESSFSGGSAPVSMAYDPENGLLYIADFTFGPGTISVVNATTQKIVSTISFPYKLAYVNYVMYDRTNNLIYAIGYFPNQVDYSKVYYNGFAEVVNPANNSIVKSIPLGYAPSAATYDPASGMIYVSNWYSDNVSVINGNNNTVVKSIPTGSNPSFVEFDSQNNLLYVTDYGSNSTTVIDTNNLDVAANLSTPGNPDATSIDPTLHLVLIAEYKLNRVALIDSDNNTIIGNITVGKGPDFMTFDPQNNLTYVANHDSGTISVIDFASFQTAFPVYLEESGLPSGKQWSVEFSQVGNFVSNSSSTSPVISINLPNGTYEYNISKVPGYSVSNNIGIFTVSGHEAVFNISFIPTQFLGVPYKVLFPVSLILSSSAVLAAFLWLRRRKGE